MAGKQSITAKAKRGDGVFYRGDYLYIQWTSAAGKRLRRRAHGNSLLEARADRAEEIRKVNLEKNYKMIPPTEKSFSAVAAEYLAEQQRKISTAGHFRESEIVRLQLDPLFAGQLAADIRPLQIKRFVTKREKEVKAATVCKELNVLKNIFSYCVGNEYLHTSPAAEISGPRVNTSEAVFLSLDEFNKVVNACPSWLRPMAAFGFYTGVRLGNLITMDWKYVNMQTRLLSLPTTKNGEPLRVTLNDGAMLVLLTLAAVQIGKGRVFNYHGEHNRVSVEFKRAAKRVGINAHFHTLRHSFCAHCSMSGMNPLVIQKLMGHKTASMTARYSHLSPDFLKGASEQMDTYFSGLLTEKNGAQMVTSGAILGLQQFTAGDNSAIAQEGMNTGDNA